jgi:hypothetical protein
MLNLERVLKQERLLRATTGLNRKAFDALIPKFEEIYEQKQIKRSSKRARGGGRKARFKTATEKLFYILFYFKCYPTFDLAGILFDLDRAGTHRWMHRLQPILEEVLGKKMVLPIRQLQSIEQFIELFPEVKEVIIDGTERSIQRSTNQEKQKLNYSGKKNRHTRKHLAGVTREKRVLVLSKAREGKLHDKKFHSGRRHCRRNSRGNSDPF